MKCRVLFIACFLLTLTCSLLAQGGQTTAKEALQELHEFIGGWQGNGTSERDKAAIWNEAMNWSWRFKGGDSWFVLQVKDSKFYKSGELRFLADKKVYQLTLIDKGDKSLVFQGSLQK